MNKLFEALKQIGSWFSNAGNSYEAPGFRANGKKTVLIIDDYVPYYDRSSGSKRLYELIKLLIQLDYHVIFLPDDGLPTEPYYSALTEMGADVLINDPGEKGILKKLRTYINGIDYAWISRPELNKKYQKIVRKNPATKIIFDTVDLHYVRMLRQAENLNSEKLKRKALKTKKTELALARSAHATLVVTDIEKKTLELEGIKNVHVIPNVHFLQLPDDPLPFVQRTGILFIGGYKHEPNTDAAKWLINDIMSLVWEKANIAVYLLGSDPGPEVLELASQDVIVPGFLPDVTEYFLKSRIFVAPLRYGAGMKGKIGQSLEFALPVVSTSIGTEGMGLTDEYDVLMADDAQGFAEKIIRLYHDEAVWAKIRSNALDSLREYTPESVSAKLNKLFAALDQ